MEELNIQPLIQNRVVSMKQIKKRDKTKKSDKWEEACNTSEKKLKDPKEPEVIGKIKDSENL